MSDEGKRSSYTSILKATSLFGGVQAFKAFIGIISTKVVALLLGPEGVGISTLLSSGLDVVGGFTSLGITKSSVRDIAEADASGDRNRVDSTVSAVRRMVFLTGLLGMLAVLMLCRPLSLLSFGNYSYAVSFAILSVVMLISQLSEGQSSLLQGFRRLKELAAVSVTSSVVSLLITTPLYWWLGVDGIVPASIAASLSVLLINHYFVRRIRIRHIRMTWKETFYKARVILNMGVAFSVAAILAKASAFALKSFMSAFGGTESVGLYSAGCSIGSACVGMIFAAIGKDFFPRLSAASSNTEESFRIVNRQGEIATIILLPLIVLRLFFSPLIIKMFFAPGFVLASEYSIWAASGDIFKLASFLIVYQMIARGDSKYYIINEVVAVAYSLLLDMLFFCLFGLEGLGVSYTLGCFLYALQVYIVTHKRYGYTISKEYFRILIPYTCISFACLGLSAFFSGSALWIIGGLLTALCCVIAIRDLDVRIGLREKLSEKLKSR